MNILVLGSDGFIGKNLCKALLTSGANVKGFDRLPDDEDHFSDSDEHGVFRQIYGDFHSPDDIDTALQGVDIVYHMISTTHPKSSNDDPVFDINSNLVSTLNLLNSCVSSGVKKVIFISSGGTVYGVPENIPIQEGHATNPICSYGITKLAIEKYLSMYHRLYGLDYNVVRLGNPYGPLQKPTFTQGVITVFLYKALRGEEVEIWGDGTVVRDYIYIDDAIAALMKLLTYQGNVKLFNLGSGEGADLNQILDSVETAIQKTVKRIYKEAREVDVPCNILDVSTIKKELNWKPHVPLAQGIKNTINYLENFSS